MCLLVAASTVGLLALLIAGRVLPDAYGQLSNDERREVGQVLDDAPQCGLLPFARVSRTDLQASTEGGKRFEFACSLTIVEIGSFDGVAECGDGSWIGPGFLEPSRSGRC